MNVEHQFSGAFGACSGCGRYVEECLDHRYCDQRPKIALAERQAASQWITAGREGVG